MSKLSISILGVAASLTMISGALAPATAMAWGDSQPGGRPSYTIDDIDDGALGDNITFNSISDGAIGEEKYFVGARLSGTSDKWDAGEFKIEDGKKYTVRLYVHNNSPKGEDAVATGVKATFSIPTTAAKSHTIVGYIDSDNATPDRYWDEVTMTADKPFYLEYVKGSAVYKNNIGSFALSDELFSTGATLGYEKMDGNIPGCFKYDGTVYIDVIPHYSVASYHKQSVRIKGSADKTWYDVIDAKVGQEVEYRLLYTNLSNIDAENVIIQDALPKNIKYVANSTVLYNSKYQTGAKLKDETLTTLGINIGTYAPKANAEIYFTGIVVDENLSDCGGIDSLVNKSRSISNGEELEDNTVVNVQKTLECPEKPEEPEEPKKTCETNPEMEGCKKIPETGAGDITAAALGAGAMVTALGYYIASRKKLM